MSCLIWIYTIQGFIQVFWERAFFAKIGKDTGHLGIKIAGVRCKICEFCMILKKLQLGMGPVFGPCEMQDKALLSALCSWISQYNMYSQTCCKAVPQIRRGERDNLGIISHISSYEHIL